MAVVLNTVNLLSFPSSSKGLSAYNYSLNVSETPFEATRLSVADSGSSSPPRKAQRLDGDHDHSVSRTRSKGKGKGKEVDRGVAGESLQSSVQKLTVDDPLGEHLTSMRAQCANARQITIFPTSLSDR